MSVEAGARPYDVDAVRREFPILERRVHGRPLVYLDNTATTQKPLSVLRAIERHYREECANVHRGLHELSVIATSRYEAAREEVARFLGAGSPREIVFTRGTTESVNLVAHGFGAGLEPGDEILVSEMEHHSNIVPWQLLAERRQTVLKVVPILDNGELDLDAFRESLGPRTRLVAIAHVSNALGTRNPVEDIVRWSHENGSAVLLDGAQGIVHEPVDVGRLGCDFYAFSGHKIYGPTGIGVLWGKPERLGAMAPFQGGGDMIETVSFEGSTWNEVPHRFEAGTPHVAGALGLAAALETLNGIGMERIAAHEHALTERMLAGLEAISEVRIVGRARRRAGVVSFNVDGIHAHDLGTILDREGIAVRAGHHCAQPVMDRFGVAATVRASVGCYNTLDEMDALVAGVRAAQEVFGA